MSGSITKLKIDTKVLLKSFSKKDRETINKILNGEREALIDDDTVSLSYVEYIHFLFSKDSSYLYHLASHSLTTQDIKKMYPNGKWDYQNLLRFDNEKRRALNYLLSYHSKVNSNLEET